MLPTMHRSSITEYDFRAMTDAMEEVELKRIGSYPQNDGLNMMKEINSSTELCEVCMPKPHSLIYHFIWYFFPSQWRHNDYDGVSKHMSIAVVYSPVNSPHKGQWRGALMFSLICAWINGWVNDGEAGDLRRHCTHYDAIVMLYLALEFNVWFIQRMMTSSNGNIFRVTGHLCGEFTGPRWIPRTKASDAELWCFLWFAPE